MITQDPTPTTAARTRRTINELRNPARRTEHDPEFGTLLFTRSSCSLVMMVLTVLALLATVIGSLIGVAWFVPSPSGSTGHITVTSATGLKWCAAMTLLTAASIFLCINTFRWRTIFKFHTQGVVRQLRGKNSTPQRLPYGRVAAVRYVLREVKYRGAHSHNNLAIDLGPDDELKREGLTTFCYRGRQKERKAGYFQFTTTLLLGLGQELESADELDAIYDQISDHLAQKILGRVRAGETVRWTPKLALSPNGLVRKGTTFPYADIRKAYIDKFTERAVIRTEGKWLSAASISLKEMNFNPGWLALNTLIEESIAEQPAASAA